MMYPDFKKWAENALAALSFDPTAVEAAISMAFQQGKTLGERETKLKIEHARKSAEDKRLQAVRDLFKEAGLDLDA